MKKYSGHIIMFIQICLMGPSYSIAKNASNEINPFVIQLLRTTGSAIIFAILFFAYREHKKIQLSRTDWINFIKVALLGIVINQSFFLVGLQYTTPTNSVLIYALTPMTVLLISVFLRRTEKLTILKLFGVLISLGGVTLVVLSSAGAKNASNPLLGNLITSIGLFTWSLYMIYVPNLVAKFTTLQATAMVGMLGGALFFPFGLTQLSISELQQTSIDAWLSVLYVMLINSTISYFMISYALRRLSSTQVSIYTNLTPFIAYVFSMLIGFDKLTPYIVIGGMLTSLGIFVLNRAPKKH